MEEHHLLQMPSSGIPGDFEYTFSPIVILTKQVWHSKQIPGDSDVRKQVNRINEKKKWVRQCLEEPIYHLYGAFASKYFAKIYDMIIIIIWRLERFGSKHLNNLSKVV